MGCELEELDQKFRQGFGEGGETASEAMKAAMADWFSLYFDREKTEQEDPSQRLGFVIVQKLCRACFAEYGASAPEGFFESTLAALDKVKGRAMQMALIGGTAWLKPVPDPETGRVWFSVIRRDRALVLERDAEGNPTAMGTGCRWQKNGRVFTLLEKRSTDKLGQLVIESRLFESARGQNLGSRVPLAALPETAGLLPKLVLPPVGGLGFAALTMPAENCVDGSAEPVGVLAAPAGLLHAIDRGERQLDREFEHGASRVFASADLLRRRGRGRELPEGLFVGLDDDPSSTGLTIFAPELRVESFLARKAEQLRALESLTGLKRGLLGPVEASPRTATEVTSSEGDYALTIRELREAWEAAAKEALELAAKIARIYGIAAPPPEEAALTVSWGDGDLRTEV